MGAGEVTALCSPRGQGKSQREWQVGALRLPSGLPMAKVWHSETQKFPPAPAQPWRCWVINPTDFRTGQHRWSNPSSVSSNTYDPRRPDSPFTLPGQQGHRVEHWVSKSPIPWPGNPRGPSNTQDQRRRRGSEEHNKRTYLIVEGEWVTQKRLNSTDKEFNLGNPDYLYRKDAINQKRSQC